MAFYDHFIQSPASEVTSLGEWLVEYQNRYFIGLIEKYSRADLSSLSVLEIGPGKGYFARQIQLLVREYLGLEANEKMTSRLNRMGFRVLHQFVPPIRLEDKFDVIFLDQVFEHMKGRDDAIELVRDFNRRLNPGGIVIISAPDILSWKEDFFAGDYTHNNPTSVRNISQVLMDFGFEVVFTNYHSVVVRGYILTRIVAFLARVGYSTGLFRLVFGQRDFKMKASLLPSCLVVGRKPSRNG